MDKKMSMHTDGERYSRTKDAPTIHLGTDLAPFPFNLASGEYRSTLWHYQNSEDQAERIKNSSHPQLVWVSGTVPQMNEWIYKLIFDFLNDFPIKTE